MPHWFFWFSLMLGGAAFAGLRAATPPLLAKAVEQWTAGREGLAFTQQTRFFAGDGKVKGEVIERYDPSLPDNRRWRLLEVDGQPATGEQRTKWEEQKNGKPKKVAKSPAEYLDLEHATLVHDALKSARFAVGLRPDAARLLAVEQIAVVITVDKESGGIAGIAATLHEPIRVLLGLARITDLDLDVRIEAAAEDPARSPGEVKTGSSARVALAKFGRPMEYHWTDFKRVTPFAAQMKPAR